MATEKQIPKLVGLLVEHQSEFTALSTPNTQWVIANPKEAITLFVTAVTNRENRVIDQARKSILRFLKSFMVPGHEKFIAGDHFKVDISEGAAVKISYLNTEFKDNFLDLVEKNVTKADLKIYGLQKDVLDLEITSELGYTYISPLAYVWSAIALQKTGQEGNLLVNRYSNIFYVADVNGVVWAVRVRWIDGGWNMCAYSTADKSRWNANNQVLSL